MEEIHEVVIVGSGIAGIATALALKKFGIQSIVLERSNELCTTSATLTLTPNPWQAFQALDFGTNLQSIYHIFEMVHVTNLITGTTQAAAFVDSGNMGLRSVHRKVLLETLANELPPNTIKFSINITSIKSQSQDITLLHLDNGSVIRTKALIGCDGVHLVVAQWLELTPPVDSGRLAVRGLAMFPDGHGFRVGLVPMNNTEVYWFLSASLTIKEIQSSLKREVLERWGKDFPSDYINVVQRSELSMITWAPLMFRVPWDVLFGKTHRAAVTVAGDAFHPMTPDLAQDGCAALEDGVVLARCLATLVGSVPRDLERYVKERRWRVAGLITIAFLSGWVQQSGSGWSWWLVKVFRDHVFYRFIFPRLADVAHYDCGALPEKEKTS